MDKKQALELLYRKAKNEIKNRRFEPIVWPNAAFEKELGGGKLPPPFN